MVDLASLRRRYRTQKALRASIDHILDEIDYYTGPPKEAGSTASDPLSDGSAGPESRRDLWDFTAIEGRERLASSIQVNALNPVLRWIQLSWQDAELNRDPECVKWLADRAEEIWSDIQDSDFNVEIGSFLGEWAGPGHAFLGVEPLPLGPGDSWQGVDFTSIPLRESYFEQDRRGRIHTFWRRHVWSAFQVADFCEDRGIPVPEDIAQVVEKGESRQYEIVCCFFKRPEFARSPVVYPSAPDRRPWGVVWWRDDKGEQLGEEDGYYEEPIYFSRYSRTAGSKWGHGPATIALPTIKYLNALLELIRASGEKAVDPPLLTDERNLVSDVDFGPGGVTVVRDPARMVPLEAKARFDVGKDTVADLRMQIRRIFHTDELELKDSPAMTATEAQIRYEWTQRLLGKSVTYLFEPIGQVVLAILSMRLRLGASPPPPDRARAKGGILAIEYQGPLARSMRTDEVAAIERAATFVAGLSQIYPEAQAYFDPGQAVKHIFRLLGVPADVVPSDAQSRKRVEEIRQAIAREREAASAQKEARAAKDAVEARAAAAVQPVAAGPLPQIPAPARLDPTGGVL